ncbi:MAG: ribonuclease H family protein [Bacillota bacterium]
MTSCCATFERLRTQLTDPATGLPALQGEPLRYCPWCGSPLGLAGEPAARPSASGADGYAVYVDGACANNQAAGLQRGGWAAVFTDGRSFSGGDKATTNNRMELRAAIEALRQTPPGSAVTVHSDSAYVVNAFLQNWFRGWEARGWRNVKGDPVENQDLWKQLRAEADKRRVTWVKVKGHAGNELNELADRLAVAAIPKQ